MKGLVIGLGLLLSTAVFAQTEQETLVNDVLEASNIKVSLAAIPNQLAQLPAMLPAMQDNTPQQQQALMQSFAAALLGKFNEAKAYDAVSAHFAAHGDADKLVKVREWLTGPVGRAITQQETLKQTGDMNGVQQFMMSFSPDSLSVERRIALQQFIDAMDMTNRIGNTTETMIPSLIRSIGQAKGESPQKIEAEITRFINELAPQIEAMKAQIKPQMDLQMLASMAYMYDDVSEQDLQAYTRFVTSDVGQHYLDLAMESVMDYSLNWIAEVIPGMLGEAEKQLAK